LKKIFFGLAAAAIAFSPLSVQVANANLVTEPTYDNLTEKLSFYRVTRGFVSPLSELDNNLNTKIEFTRLNTLTYMDYVFLDDIYINNITFKSDDSAKYQRILLMQNGQIRKQLNLIDYPSGVIPVDFDTTTIDMMKLQFNGIEGTQHTLAELEIVGKKATTAGANPPQGESKLVTPQVIAELVAPVPETNPGDGGEGTPVVDPPPVVVEEPPTGGGDGDGTPVVEEPPVVVEEPPTGGGDGDGTPVVEEPPVVEDGDVGIGGSGDPVIPVEEPPVIPEENIGDKDFIDNDGDGIEDPIVPEEGTVTPPVEEPVVVVPGDGGVVTPPVEEPVVVVPPVEEPVVVTPPVEEPVVVIPPVEEPVVVTPPVVIVPPVEDFDFCKVNPLTPSVFHSKHFSSHYWINSASLKLFTHNHFNETYLLNNLKNSSVYFDGKKMNIKEFIILLKLSKFTKYNNVKPGSKDCVEAPKKDHKHNHKFHYHNHKIFKNLHEHYNGPVKKDYDSKGSCSSILDKYKNNSVVLKKEEAKKIEVIVQPVVAKIVEEKTDKNSNSKSSKK
jgi:hypothetical protein